MNCLCSQCKRIAALRAPWMKNLSPGAEDVWTPDGTKQGATITLPDRDDGTHIDVFQFECEYRGVRSQVKVVRQPSDPISLIEDLIGNAFERFKAQVDRVKDADNGNPGLSPEQKKQVGPILRDIKHHRQRRLTRNMLYFPGAN